VPVSLVGAFMFFPLLGFSINVLSLLGLVLAIGIVVDDAIVVVEAVMHHIEHGMEPKEATIKAMEEVSGPVIRDRPHPDRRVRPGRASWAELPGGSTSSSRSRSRSPCCCRP
jgi:hypothetical protein